MRPCHDLAPVVEFLKRHDPACRSLLNIVTGRGGEPAAWIRADNPEAPRAVIARLRMLYCYSPDPHAGRRLLERLPVRWNPRLAAAPEWACRKIRERGRLTWQTSTVMYRLESPAQLRFRPRHRVGPLTPDDAPVIARYWPYGRRSDYILRRIALGPTAGIRRKDRLAAWALTHSDGSMGFLHVLEEFRGRDMARSIGAWLARRQLAAGIGAFVYIEKKNRASINMTESLGFRRVGNYYWCGQ